MMKQDKRRLDRRWNDKIRRFHIGLLFVFGMAVGAGLYSFLKGV